MDGDVEDSPPWLRRGGAQRRGGLIGNAVQRQDSLIVAARKFYPTILTVATKSFANRNRPLSASKKGW